MSIPKPPQRRRRWWKVLALLAIGLIALIVALPWALGTGAGRRWIVARANRALAPGRLEMEAIRLSWFGPTRITGLVLRDAQGDRVIVAPGATWNRNFGQILTDRARYGEFVLKNATLDVERLPDGKVDLFETIKPILSKDPRTDLTIQFPRAQLTFRSAGLSEPVTADPADFTLTIPPSPRPLAWILRMGKLERGNPEQMRLWMVRSLPPRGPQFPFLMIEGTYQRWNVPPGESPDVNVELAGTRWPWAIESGGLASRGEFEGLIRFARKQSQWSSEGRATLGGLDANGPRLVGDHLRLDRVAGVWDVSKTANGLMVRRLDLTSPLGTLKANGPMPAPPGKSALIEGTLDLAGLASQLPHALRLREGIALDQGSARLRVEGKNEADRQAWEVEARVSDLKAHDAERSFSLHEPATVATRLLHHENVWKVERFDVKTAFLDGSGHGNLDEGVAWTARLDLGGLRRQLDDLVDFGRVELAGTGRLEGNYRRNGPAFEGRVSADLTGLQVAGEGLGTLHRDKVRLDLALNGPASSEGWPKAWSDLRLGLRSGEATANLKARAPEAGPVQIGAKFEMPDPFRNGDDGAIGGSLEAVYHRPEGDRFQDRLDLSQIALQSRYTTLEASGAISDLKGTRRVDLKGRLMPDWKAINSLLAERIEPGARVVGQPRSFQLQGALGGDTRDGWLKSIDGELGIDLTSAEFYGMKLGPTPIVLRPRSGKLALDPIDTTLNAGRIHLEPELALDDEKGASVRLGPSSTIEGAEVNDAVSHRVLSFVAPVLDSATRARGRVSVALKEAIFPLGSDSTHKTKVDGSVVFEDVEFLPGPLADELLGLIGRADRPGLKLDEPVALTIADRRVYQHGLAIPIGNVTRIELEGWVDFDRNLNLTASLPVTSTMVFNRPVLSAIAEGTRFKVPIRGTLKKPEIDKDAMNLALQDLGKTLLLRGATQGLPALLNRMTQPRDPNAPPPLTPQERRERRLERRAQRRGIPPPDMP